MNTTKNNLYFEVNTPNSPIMFYDGVCNLCNQSVQFVYKHDGSKNIRFLALQSETARGLLTPYGIDANKLNSVIFIKNEQIYLYSAAVIEIGRTMGGVWAIGGLGYLIPAFIRNVVYRLIATHRYRFWGVKSVCERPTPEFLARVLI